MLQSPMRKILALLLAVLLLGGLLPALPHSAAAGTTYVLPVFETSDVHGHLLDSSASSEDKYQYRLAYIADKVDDVRAGDADRTVLLDGGDIYQGNVVSNLQHGAPMVAAYDAMEYDAVALGNHEFDWGVTTTTDPDGTMPHYTWNGTEHDSQIPILCCNIFYAGTNNRVNFTQDYTLLEKTAVASDGTTLSVKIAVVGYVDNYASSIMSSEIAPYTIKSGVSRAETIARELKSQGLADAAILLTHADAESVAGKLASGSPFDLVCGGHSHQTESGKKNGVSYMEPGAKAGYYGYVEFRFGTDRSLSVGTPSIQTVPSSSTYDVAANKNELAPDVLTVSHEALDGVAEVLKTELGYITTSVTGQAIGGNPMSTTGGNWMADLANRATGSEVSFTNSGGIRTSFYVNYGTRPITMGDIYTIAPFNNLLYVYDLSYAELLSVLQYAVGRGSGLGLRMSGIDCYYTGSSVTALVRQGECIYLDGVWKEDWAARTVRVSANEFIATSSGTPFYQWNTTGRFVDNELTDNESFIAVLRAEGEANNGFLYVDPEPHLIQGSYNGSIQTYYQVTTDCGAGGTITEGARVPAGSNYTVTATPDPGYEVDYLIVDGIRREDRVSCNFTNIQADHHVSAFFRETDPCGTITDVDHEAWYAEAVHYALLHGLFRGTSATTFSPAGTMNRGMLVTVLHRMAGTPAAGQTARFTDVAEGLYYTDAVAWAAEQGIVKGYPDGSFRPAQAVTREQLVTFLQRYAVWDGADVDAHASLDAFPDAQTVSTYALDPVRWAVAAGLLQGTTINGVVCIAPQRTTNRAQVAMILMRYLTAEPG